MVLRLGIVGCGDIARYAAFFARLNRGIRLAACCDANIEKAQAFARRYGIPLVFSTLNALLDAGGMDAVYLAVPHYLHLPMIAAAVERGLHVLVEKPLAGSLEDGVEAAKIASAPGAPRVAVNYQYRYDAACYAMARAAQRGDLGEIRYARINVPWKREEGYFLGASWHASKAMAGGGTLLTQGSHFLDIALWACRQPVRAALGFTARRVFTGVEVEDLAIGVLELASGAAVEICSSMVAAREGPAAVEIYGSRATAFYHAGARPGLRFEGQRGLRIRQERLPVPGAHALARSLEGFRRWAQGGAAHLAPASDTLPVLRAVDAVYRSAQRGERIVLEVDHG